VFVGGLPSLEAGEQIADEARASGLEATLEPDL
jgi:hypothetical protein